MADSSQQLTSPELHGGSDPGELARKGTPWGSIAVVLIALLSVAGLAAYVLFPLLDTGQRIEREHSIQLPESASDLQALGNATGTWMSLIGIDRGASSIMVIERSDLDELFGQFTATDSPFGALDGSPAPANDEFQPDTVPWESGAEIERALFTTSPPSSADFAQINAYQMDDPDLVGIWIYSDWN